jgi:hypothetical protein
MHVYFAQYMELSIVFLDSSKSTQLVHVQADPWPSRPLSGLLPNRGRLDDSRFGVVVEPTPAAFTHCISYKTASLLRENRPMGNAIIFINVYLFCNNSQRKQAEIHSLRFGYNFTQVIKIYLIVQHSKCYKNYKLL